MQRLLPLLLALMILGCSAPAPKFLERDSNGIPEPSVPSPETGAITDEGITRGPALFEDVWRDSRAGWAVTGRAFSRNFRRDMERVEALFD